MIHQDVPNLPISRLMYSSVLASGLDTDDVYEEVKKIATTASARNDMADVTGSLLFIDETFIQVLEGPVDQVENIFEMICRDFRHKDIKLIDYNMVDKRLFPEWRMAFLSEREATSVQLRDELKEIKFMAGVNAREAVMQMRSVLDAKQAA